MHEPDSMDAGDIPLLSDLLHMLCFGRFCTILVIRPMHTCNVKANVGCYVNYWVSKGNVI